MINTVTMAATKRSAQFTPNRAATSEMTTEMVTNRSVRVCAASARRMSELSARPCRVSYVTTNRLTTNVPAMMAMSSGVIVGTVWAEIRPMMPRTISHETRSSRPPMAKVAMVS